jgi:hypothetical protein
MSEFNGLDFLQMTDPNYKCDYSLVLGLALSGKTLLCNLLKKLYGFKVIDWKVIEEMVKKSLGTEEEPFEGTVTTPQLEAKVMEIIKKEKSSGAAVKFVFDGFPHTNGADFGQFCY